MRPGFDRDGVNGVLLKGARMRAPFFFSGSRLRSPRSVLTCPYSHIICSASQQSRPV